MTTPTRKRIRNQKHDGALSGRVVVVLCFGMALAFFIKSTFILVLLGMLPSIVAFYVDTGRMRTLFGTVFACNLAGVLPYVIELLVEGNTSAAFLRHFTDVRVWFVMYFSAGLGWFLVRWGAAVVGFALELSARAKISHLESIQRKLIEEWGAEISHDTNAPLAQ